MTTINENLELVTDDGRMLTRSEIAALVDSIERKHGRPYFVYLATDERKTRLKIGITKDTQAREYTLKDETVGTAEMVYWIKVSNRAVAERIERSILGFMRVLRGSPVHNTEWFILTRRDFELIQWIMMNTPYAALAGLFEYLAANYNEWMMRYLASENGVNERDVILEEIELSVGRLVLSHFQQEMEHRFRVTNFRRVPKERWTYPLQMAA